MASGSFPDNRPGGMAIHLKGLLRAEFDYASTSTEELSITEGSLLFLLDDSDREWWTVRPKLNVGLDSDDAPQGLVPASYVAQVEPIGHAQAMYAFDATNTEELSVQEAQPLNLYSQEEEWSLVGTTDGSAVGYVPTSYLEASLPVSAPTLVRTHAQESDAAPPASAPVQEEPALEAPDDTLVPPPPLHPHRASGGKDVSNPTPQDHQADQADAARGQHDGQFAIVQYDFAGEGQDELSVAENERVLVINSGDDDWWLVQREATQEQGVVPATFLDVEEATQQPSESVEAEDGTDHLERQAAALQIQQDEERARAVQRKEDRAARKAADERDLRMARGIPDVPKPPPMPARARSSSSSNASSTGPIPAPRPIPVPQPVAPGPPNLTKPPTPSQPEITKSSGSSEKRTKPDANKTRVWKDRSGQFKVEAQFLGLSGNKIRLHKSNGVVIDVPMEKMSPEDIKVIQSITGQNQEQDAVLTKEQERDKRRRERRASRDHHANGAGPSTAPRPVPQQRKKPTVDWFGFFLDAGCDLDDCTRYAANFDRDRIDEEVLPELEAPTMRSLGLREGDVIRVRKAIKQKYGRSAAFPSEESTPPVDSGPLFTGPSGGLKTTRRGRPQATRQASAVSPDGLATASDHLSGAVQPAGSPDLSNSGSPSSRPSRRSSSTQPITSGFDDDAWTVKGPSKPSTPAPSGVQPPMAPAPPPAPQPPQGPRPTERAKSTAPLSSSGSLSDSILANMGIGARPPSAPVQRQQSLATGTSNLSAGSFEGSPQSVSPQPTQANPNAPRGPFAPVAQNAPLLNPLVPTTTAFAGFIPTRPPASQPPLQMLPTGYVPPQQTGFVPQQTGFVPQQQTGFVPQQTGFGQQVPMMPQQTGFPMQQQQQPLQPQPTGFASMSVSLPQIPQQTGFVSQAQPTMFAAHNAPPVPALPSIFNPQPQAQQQQANPNRFDPNNVFAAMKQGTTHTQKLDAMPQPENRYDALRPQPTGFPQQTFGVQPQPTGFVSMQPTGFMPAGYRPAY